MKGSRGHEAINTSQRAGDVIPNSLPRAPWLIKHPPQKMSPEWAGQAPDLLHGWRVFPFVLGEGSRGDFFPLEESAPTSLTYSLLGFLEGG